jgi:hypothetical protein
MNVFRGELNFGESDEGSDAIETAQSDGEIKNVAISIGMN